MIIYGWGHFNRRDHSIVRGHCESCDRQGYQRSYKSSRFFTLYFIPLIPLGNQKILRECPHCKSALGMSYRKWTKLKRTELPKAVAAYEANPTDPAAAGDLLATLFTLQDRATLRRVGPEIRSTFADNAEVLAQLAGTYGHLCLDQEADKTYLDAVALSDDESLAAEADAHIELQKESIPKPPNRFLQSLPVLIVPAVLLFLLTSFVQRSASSRIGDAYVLSGIDRPYTVLINGEAVSLRPFQRIAGTMLVYGDNEVAPTADSPFVSHATFRVDRPWYRRAFGGPAVIVNPDRAAVLLWEKSGYAYPAAPEDGYEFRFATGRSSYIYDDVDYVFAEFPEMIDMPSGQSIVYRQRISALTGYEPIEIVQTLLGNGHTDELQGYLLALLRAGHDDPTTIHLGGTFLAPEAFEALAEPRLADRPVHIEWHRAYQRISENAGAGDSLVARYRAYLEAEPEDSALTYLLGRIMADPDEKRELFERATELPARTGYAAHALAYYHLLEGDFATALAYANEACELAPGTPQFQTLRVSALYGTGDFATVETETGDLLADGNLNYVQFYDHVYRLAKLGRSEEARLEITRFLDRLARESRLTDDDRKAGSAYLESALAVALGDRRAYAAIASRMADPGWAFQHAIITGNLDAAVEHVATDADEFDARDRMTLYILLSRAGKKGQAEAQLQEVIAEFSAGSADERRWADWLRGDTAPELKYAAHTCPDIHTHFLYLATLAERYPARAAEYRSHAAAIRTRDSFYSLALAQVPSP